MKEPGAQAPLVAALGARGTGKTPWIKQQVQRARPARTLTWDPQDEYGDLGTVFTDRARDRLVDFVGSRRVFGAVYRPGLKVSTYGPKFDWFCRLAWALGDLTMIVDELADVTTPSWAPDSWSVITRKGGHQRLATFGASQRPAELDKSFLDNSTYMHVGRCNGKPACSTMGSYLGVDPAELAALPDLAWIERNMRTGAVRRGNLTF